MLTLPMRITGGSLVVFRNHGPNFSLAGKRFCVTGGREPGNVSADAGSPYVPGDYVSLESRFAGELSLGSGPAAINGNFYPRLYYTGELNFIGEPILVPSQDALAISKMARFTFTGTLNGYTTYPFVGPGKPVFSYPLNGEGIATLQLSSYTPSPGLQLHEFKSLIYTFQTTKL